MLRPGNSFKRCVGKGPPLFGFWLSLCSPAAAEIAAHSGADWVLIDMEHAPNELFSVTEQLRAAEDVCPVIARPPDSSQTIVKRLLDIGVKSLMFPMIDTPAQAQAAVSWTRYPPKGVRGMASVVRASGYGRDTAYRARQEDEICVIVQAETPLALANIPEIAAIDGVDAIFIGPGDLAAAMGYAGTPEAPIVQKAIRDGLRAIKRAGKAAGILGYGATNARSLCADGADFVAVGADNWLLARETTALIAACRADGAVVS